MLSYSGLEGRDFGFRVEGAQFSYIPRLGDWGELVQLHFTRVRSCLQAFAKNELVPPVPRGQSLRCPLLLPLSFVQR